MFLELFTIVKFSFCSFFPAAPKLMTPESIEYYTKKFKYLSKTFLPIFQKFCLFWPQSLQEPKTFQKNPTGQADLQKKPTSHFNFVWNFFPFCLALLNRMGKRRRHAWMSSISQSCIQKNILWILSIFFANHKHFTNVKCLKYAFISPPQAPIFSGYF